MTKKIIVIKTGGRAASDRGAMKELFMEMKQLSDKYSFVFVHGGGAEVSRISKIFGHEPQFVDGIRLTTKEEMEVVDMVLSGRVNKEIVRLANTSGLNAIGLSGSDSFLFTGERRSKDSHTGVVTDVKCRILKILMKESIIPVVSSTSMSVEGTALNINADEAALAISSDLKADRLFFISDIPGVMKNEKVINVMNEENIENEISEGVISGGMIPKVKSSIAALKEGVLSISIGEYKNSGDLDSILSEKKGTSIIL
jgi:acetylglutamate kinase